jgi:hypothetical protein
MRTPSPRRLHPYKKAQVTGRWAEIIFRALSTRVASPSADSRPDSPNFPKKVTCYWRRVAHFGFGGWEL